MWERKAISPRPKMVNKQENLPVNEAGNKATIRVDMQPTVQVQEYALVELNLFLKCWKNSDCFKNSKIHYFKIKNTYNYSEFFKCNQT